MNTMLGWIVRLTLGKKLLSLVDWANSFLTGYRTQLIVVLILIVATLNHVGLLAHDISASIITALLGALPLTVAEKVGNVLEKADKVLPPPSTPA